MLKKILGIIKGTLFFHFGTKTHTRTHTHTASEKQTENKERQGRRIKHEQQITWLNIITLSDNVAE